MTRIDGGSGLPFQRPGTVPLAAPEAAPEHPLDHHHHHHHHHHHDHHHGSHGEAGSPCAHLPIDMPVPAPPPIGDAEDWRIAAAQQASGHVSGDVTSSEAGAPTGPAQALGPAAVAPPPITIDTVKDAAREYLAKHPEIENEPSYENRAAVAQLREGVIAILAAKGYRVGRILGPDGQPYDQMVAFGNLGDPDAHAYRVAAGGGPIREAITVGYCNDNIPWADVH